jgi:5'-nucleotidase
MKKYIALILGCMLLSSNVYGQSTTNDNQNKISTTLDIVHTTDIHGNAEGTDSYLGYDKIAGYIDELRGKTENTLVLDSGDTFEGLPFANITKGESIAEILKLIKYDAMTLGNHEFVYDTQTRTNDINKAEIPVVSANITDEDGNYIYDEYTIKEYNGVKVGIFGLTTETTKLTVMKENTENIQFQDAENSAKKAVADLKNQGCDYIIAITHLGSSEEDDYSSIKVAEAVDGIDLLLDGNSHIVNEGTMYGDTLLVASGHYGEEIGHIKVDFEDGDAVNTEVEMLTVDDIDTIDKEVSDVVSKYVNQNKDYFATVVANTDITWNGASHESYQSQTPLGVLIAESYRNAGNADIGIVNGGGVRQTINAGAVTINDLYAVQPFGNTVKGYYVPGKTIIETVKESLKNYNTGSFLQFSGIKASYNIETGEILSISLADGTAIDENKNYKVATSNYVIDAFPCLAETAEYITDYGIDYEVTVKYIEEYGMLQPTILMGDIKDENQSVLTDIDNHWAKDYIVSALEKGFVSGYANSAFKPDNSVTRAEFIKILYNIGGNEEVNDISFSDITGTEWYFDGVKWAVANGLIQGYEDNTFRGNDEISREEAAVILDRFLNNSNEGNAIEFIDYSLISPWAKESVDEISKMGIMTGDNNGCFNPKNSLTRAEAAVIANKIA